MKRFLSRTVVAADGIHQLSVVELSADYVKITPFDCERESTSYVDHPIAIVRSDIESITLKAAMPAQENFLDAAITAIKVNDALWTKSSNVAPKLLEIDCSNKRIIALT